MGAGKGKDVAAGDGPDESTPDFAGFTRERIADGCCLASCLLDAVSAIALAAGVATLVAVAARSVMT